MQNDIPRAGHTMPPFRNYILDAVIRWHGCFRVLIIPHHCQLEKSWLPRAMAHPQLQIEEVNTTSPWYLHCTGRWAHKVSSSTPCPDWVRYDQQWTLRKLLVLLPMYGNISKELIINSSLTVSWEIAFFSSLSEIKSFIFNKKGHGRFQHVHSG